MIEENSEFDILFFGTNFFSHPIVRTPFSLSAFKAAEKLAFVVDYFVARLLRLFRSVF